MWLTLALLSAGSPKGDPVVPLATKAIEASPRGTSIEWYALRLLLAIQAEEVQSSEEFVDALCNLQRDDGGWGWLVDDESDALGTGLALYALSKAGLKHSTPQFGRAKAFLIKTQRADGSWPVNGTKKAKKDRLEETAVCWGTTWAVIGLMTGLTEQGD